MVAKFLINMFKVKTNLTEQKNKTLAVIQIYLNLHNYKSI